MNESAGVSPGGRLIGNTDLREAERARLHELAVYSRPDFDFHACIRAACENAVLREMPECTKQEVRPIAMQITPILVELLHDHGVLRRLTEEERAEEPRDVNISTKRR